MVMLISLTAHAYDFSVDGLYYNIVSLPDRTCSLTYKEVQKINGISGGFNDYDSDSLIIPSTVEYAGQTIKVIGVDVQAFEYNTAIKTVVIPSTIKWLHQECFDGCTSLREVTIEDGETILNFFKKGRSGYFNDCPIEKLYIGRQISIIDDWDSPFRNLTNLIDVVLTSSTTEIVKGMFEGCTSLKCIELPSECISIQKNAFSGCTELEAIQFPLNLTLVGDNAFSDCSLLKNAEFLNIETIGAGAFNGCSSLEEIIINDGITELPTSVFQNCSNLSSFRIPNTVEIINSSAFRGCSSLRKIQVPSAVTKIGRYSFEGCTSLDSLIFDKGDSKIVLSSCATNQAFSIFGVPKNSTIKYLEINRLLSNDYTFYYSGISKLVINTEEMPGIDLSGINLRESPLQKIYCYNSTPPSMSGISFTTNQYMTVNVYVPKQSLDLYKSNYYWNKFWQLNGMENSSINDIIVDNANGSVVYFLPNGIKISQKPSSGLYFEVKNGIAVKKVGHP